MISFPTPLEGALWAAARGLQVIPLGAGSKVPVLPGWQKRGSSLPEDIKRWAKNYPDCNFGMVCDGMVVVDLDVKNGVDGRKELKALLEADKIDFMTMKTLAVKTPNGMHLYFNRGSTQIKNQTSQLAKGIDIKTDAGQVVLPGSVVNGKSYVVVSDTEIRPLPTWLTKKLQNTSAEEWSWPDRNSNGKVSAGSRNNTHFRFGLHLRSIGAPGDLIRRCMQIVNEEFTEIPSPAAELESTYRSVCKRRPHEAKILFDFDLRREDIENWEGNSSKDIDVETIPPRRWLIKDHYPLGFYTVLLSPGGVGKSTISLLHAMALISGRPLTGHEVITPGNVWLYNIEDPKEEIERRIAAMALYHGIDLKTTPYQIRYDSGRDRPLTIVKQTRNGIETNWADIQAITDVIIREKYKLVVLDPFVQLHAVSENDNQAIAAVVLALQHILKHTDCCIEVIHHTHKLGDIEEATGDQNVSRGASALIDGARAAYTLLPMGKITARRIGLNEDGRASMIRLDSAKCNILPPATKAEWFQRREVMLANSDIVGVLMRTTISAEQEIEDDARILADMLASHMEPGDNVTISQALNWAKEDPYASAVIGKDTNWSVCAGRLKSLVDKNPASDGVVFSLDTTGKRPKIQAQSQILPNEDGRE